MILDIGINLLGDPWGWFELDHEQRVEMMAVHRIRTASAHKASGKPRTPKVADMRWGTCFPASLSDVGELAAAMHKPAEADDAAEAAKFLRGIGVSGEAARAIAGVPRG